jgi:hypothetical protein
MDHHLYEPDIYLVGVISTVHTSYLPSVTLPMSHFPQLLEL